MNELWMIVGIVLLGAVLMARYWKMVIALFLLSSVALVFAGLLFIANNLTTTY